MANHLSKSCGTGEPEKPNLYWATHPTSSKSIDSEGSSEKGFVGDLDRPGFQDC